MVDRATKSIAAWAAGVSVARQKIHEKEKDGKPDKPADRMGCRRSRGTTRSGATCACLYSFALALLRSSRYLAGSVYELFFLMFHLCSRTFFTFTSPTALPYPAVHWFGRFVIWQCLSSLESCFPYFSLYFFLFVFIWLPLRPSIHSSFCECG